MAKYPSEIFGCYFQNVMPEAEDMRRKFWCPFHESQCYKQSRLIDFPFGVCFAQVDGQEIALCPRRFLEKNKVFQTIAISQFGTSEDVLVFSEVGLPGIGNFDFVMVKHKPFRAQVDDFVAIEFQTGQTTSTGQLVKGFKTFMKDHRFPEGTSYHKVNDNRLDLVATRMFSSTVDDLFDAFRRNDDIPPVEKFVERLESKLSGDMQIALHLSREKTPSKFDAPKPGATGRVRELFDQFTK